METARNTANYPPVTGDPVVRVSAAALEQTGVDMPFDILWVRRTVPDPVRHSHGKGVCSWRPVGDGRTLGSYVEAALLE
jgi:hypothetical protein